MSSADSEQIFSQARERAHRLADTLERQHAELAESESIDSVTKDAGLAAIQRVIESSRRLAARMEEAIAAATPNPSIPAKVPLND